MKKNMITLLFFVLANLALNAQTSCTDPKVCWPFTVTDNNHTIIIEASTQPMVDGMPLPVGSYIGVFFETSGHLQSAGYTQWTGKNISLAAFGNDGSNPPLGFTPGQALHFKFLLPDGTVIDDVNVKYKTPDGTLVTNTGAYIADGVSSFTSLVGYKSLSVSAGDNLQAQNFRIYPNPATDELMIEWPGKETRITLTVMDLAGQEVLKQELNTAVDRTLDISKLNNGMFMLMVEKADEQREYLKFVKIGNR